MEIGGYIELDSYSLPMLHEDAVALNCGRNCLAYVLRARNIKKILLPRFLCDSVHESCQREDVQVTYYSVDKFFRPVNIVMQEDEWLYIVNYYGQFDNAQIRVWAEEYSRIIVDNAQAYFQLPVQGIDTLYTCRKFFGVPDGAFLYTDVRLEQALPKDESFERMHFLLGRYERTASEFYGEYSANNHLFGTEPIKSMSKLTDNLLRGIDYEAVKKQRTENFEMLHDAFREMNALELTVPEGAFMYPLYIPNGAEIRRQLQAKKIYIPTLWPDVFACCTETDMEYDMAKNILPLPVDQRYAEEEMQYIISEVRRCIS